MAFVAAFWQGFFLFFRFYCAAILPCFFVFVFFTRKDCYVQILLYVVGGEKYTYDRKYT